MSASSSSSARSPRSSRSRRQQDRPQLPTFTFIDAEGRQRRAAVQQLEGRGIRCRDADAGGFISCPDEVRNSPQYSQYFQNLGQRQAGQRVPKTPIYEFQGIRYQIINNRVRCRRPGTGQFGECPAELLEFVASQNPNVQVSYRVPQSPEETIMGVRVQYIPGRGWRCRDQNGGFMPCPEGQEWDAILERPAPPGIEEAYERVLEQRRARRGQAGASSSRSSRASAASSSQQMQQQQMMQAPRSPMRSSQAGSPRAAANVPLPSSPARSPRAAQFAPQQYASPSSPIASRSPLAAQSPRSPMAASAASSSSYGQLPARGRLSRYASSGTGRGRV